MSVRTSYFIGYLFTSLLLLLYVFTNNSFAQAQDEAHQTYLPYLTHDISIRHNLVGVIGTTDGIIYSMRSDAVDPVSIVENGAYNPVWAPTGEWISYSQVVSDTQGCTYCNQAILMKPDGSDKRPLLPLSGGTTAYWAPQGDYLYVIHNHCQDTTNPKCEDLYLTTPASDNVVPFMSNVQADYYKWSSDGQKLAYLLKEPYGDGFRLDLYLIDVESQIPIKLYENIAWGTEYKDPLVWSHNSEKLVFTIKESLETDLDIAMVDVNDRLVHRITDNDTEEEVVGWVEDGNRLLVTWNARFYLLDLNGSSTLFLDLAPNYPTQPVKVYGILPNTSEVLYQYDYTHTLYLKSTRTDEIITFHFPNDDGSWDWITYPVSLSPSGRFFAYKLYVDRHLPSTPADQFAHVVDLASDPDNPRVITTYSPDHFQWTPDSRYLVVQTLIENHSLPGFTFMDTYRGTEHSITIPRMDFQRITDSWYYREP